VAVETVEESATRERADDVAEGLRGEEHADLADTGAGTLPEFGQRRTEQGKGEPDDHEARQVEGYGPKHVRTLR